MMTAQRARRSDGGWFFQHGPIDIVIGAEGEPAAVAAAHEQAWARFQTVLEELVAELPLLRQAVQGRCVVKGRVARRMWSACEPFSSGFITAMASVAGAVAQELVEHYQRPGIGRAWVNNGGDIALHLAPEHSVRIGLYADLARLDTRQLTDGLDLDGHFEVAHSLPVRGVATSGWRGRSFSLGIADSVTVLARSAAEADAAATAIGNAVDVRHPGIVRRPANQVKDDSDLADRLVTVETSALPPTLVAQALRSGLQCAETLRSAGLIWAAVLVCQGQLRCTETAGWLLPATTRDEAIASVAA